MSRLNKNPDPVKLVINFFYREDWPIEKLIERMAEKYGKIEAHMPAVPFSHTTYYNKEMGDTLLKTMVCFEELVDRGKLAEIKIQMDELEQILALENNTPGERPVNIDPGFLFPEKLVLATGKNFPHRIYVGDGVYADLTLIFRGNKFEFLPWTYTDYLEREVLHFLEVARSKLISKLRKMRKDGLISSVGASSKHE